MLRAAHKTLEIFRAAFLGAGQSPELCIFVVNTRRLMCRMVDEAFATFPEAFPCTMPAPPAEAAPTMALATDTPAGASERLV